MPSAVSPYRRAGSSAPENDPNASNYYDDAVEDFMRDLPGADHDQRNTTEDLPARDIDEEVKVTKKRKPVAKLDEARLLSTAGIPELRRRANKRLKLRGKGHEFTDISNLLNTYQLWLDDLYPRAKFRDGLAMVEKIGHTKRMQVMRRAWMDQTKAGRRREDDDIERRIDEVETNGQEEVAMSGALGDNTAQPEPDQQETRGRAEQSNADVPDDDDLDALLAEESGNAPARPSAPARSKQRGPFEEEDEPEDDELDALLAEGPFESNRTGSKPGPVPRANEPADFADEEDVMAEMGGDW